MRFSYLISAALAVAVLPSMSTAAYAGDSAIEAPIRQMEKAFNSGDIKAVRAAHVAAPFITDEFGTPFHWSGPGSLDRWLVALAKAEKVAGKSGGVVAFGSPIRESVDQGRAYVITPSTYRFQQNGKTMLETGTITFVLVKRPAGWKIDAWTWSSPEGVPVN